MEVKMIRLLISAVLTGGKKIVTRPEIAGRCTHSFFRKVGRAAMGKILLPTLFLVLFPLASYAGDLSGVKILAIASNPNDSLLIYFTVAHTVPDCARGYEKRYVISAKNKTAIAAALTAFATGRTVSVQGTNTCGTNDYYWSDTETVLYFTVYP